MKSFISKQISRMKECKGLTRKQILKVSKNDVI